MKTTSTSLRDRAHAATRSMVFLCAALSNFAAVTMLTSLTGCAHRSELRARDTEITTLRGQVGTLEEQVDQLGADYRAALGRATELEAELRGLGDREHLQVERTRDCTILRLPEHVLFDTASAYIARPGIDVLDRLAEILARYPEHEIRVEGHTDDLPLSKALKERFASNWELSCLRAGTVVRYMIYHHKLDPTRFVAVGYAQYRPIDRDATADARARNRRVEFHIAMTPIVQDLAARDSGG